MIAAIALLIWRRGEVCLYSHLDEDGNLHRILLNKDRGIELRCGNSSIMS